jgi:hypothetical protein
MTETANLGLPFIDGSQAQKHVTHNEALRILDDAIQIAVLDNTLTVPPSSPVDGERHIIASGASGAWAGQGDAVATWETNAWRFLAPKTGWCVWSIADDALLVFDGSAWAPVTTGSSTLDNAPYFGVNATVTGSNLLTVRSNDALLNAIDATDGGTGDVRLQLSKSATANTSSVVFSDAFSGRAEFGLTGDNDFHLKVSADGTTWRDALKFDRTTGRVSFPSGGAREPLAANRTYYVRADGSDSNDGLSNASGGAFLTIQKAVDAVAGLDTAGFNVIIQIADGTYAGAVTLKNVVGFSAAGNLVIQGNNTTPANVLVNVSSAYAFLADGISTIWDIKDLKLQNSSGYGMSARSGARVRFRNINFGACAGAAHIQASGPGSTVTALSNYAVSGGGTAHFEVTYGAQFVSPTFTVTITNTPSFSLAWVFLSVLGSAHVHGMTFSGSATGARYSINNGSVLFTNGAGTSYMPGSASGAGTNFATSPYGLYI